MLNFTIIKLSLLVMVGILLGFYFKFPVETLLPWSLLLLSLFLVSFFRTRRLFFQDMFFGFNLFILFVYIGMLATSIHLPQNKQNHYLHSTPNDSKATGLMIVHISEKLKPGLFQDKYIAAARFFNGKTVGGKILLNISRDSTSLPLEPGQIIAVEGTIIAINKPLNPYQFNYSDYMENLGVLRQMNTSKEVVILLDTTTSGLKGAAGKLRATIIENLRKTSLGHEELAIVQALLLGQRQEITQELYSNYAAAGVIHILAVSGLHVGILLLLLNRALQPLERLRYGKFFKTLLLLLLMWGFAVLAGLSPSVVRAVSMFSFVAVGMQLNRRTSVLNTLFMSLLVLLLINPGFITQVGFQLSYAAVFSIVLIQPHLFDLYKGDVKIIKYFWGILSVTLAAQLGVLPLSLFYFHQFPGLFFLSNIVVLPFLGLLLGTGIVIMLLASLQLLPNFLATGFGWMITQLNTFVEWVASKEDFLFENIGFSLLLCILSYFIVIAIILLLKDFRAKTLMGFLLTIIGFQAGLFYEKFSGDERESLVFHKSRNTVIGIKNGSAFTLFHDLESPVESYSFIKDYTTARNIEDKHIDSLKNFYNLHGVRVLQIDGSSIYNVPNFHPDVVLLTNSPRLNVERMLALLNPGIIVADGSNFPSLIARWKLTASAKKIPFHATGEKGAYKIYPRANP